MGLVALLLVPVFTPGEITLKICLYSRSSLINLIGDHFLYAILFVKVNRFEVLITLDTLRLSTTIRGGGCCEVVVVEGGHDCKHVDTVYPDFKLQFLKYF